MSNENSKLDAERELFQAYLDDCQEHDLEPNVAGAFRFALQTSSLPVGVPDVERLRTVFLFLDGQGELEGAQFDEKPVGYPYFWWRKHLREAVEPFLAAPTVKAEQVQCDECGGNGAGGDHEDDCSKAPSLPTAGSAGEEVEVVGYRFFHVDHGYIFRRTHIYEGNPSLEAHGLMTVAQHERIVAALSAQQSAHVSAPSGWVNGFPPVGELCEARIPHHTADGMKMLWSEVEVIAHSVIQGVVYSWVKEPGDNGGFYAPMMLSFRRALLNGGEA